MSAIARAAGGCYACCRSAPATTASTARPSSPWTSISIRQSHELREARDAALAIVQAVREPLVVLDSECRVGLANDAFYALVGETAEQVEGKHIWDGARGIWTEPRAAAVAAATRAWARSLS